MTDRTPSGQQGAYQLACLLKKVRRRIATSIRAELEPIGLSWPVVQIIKRLSSGGDPNQLQLAQDIELEPAALSRLLAELELQKLVTRRRDPGDKRRVLITVAPAGAALLVRAQPRIHAGVDALFSRLSRAEQGQLCRLLEKLTDDEEEVSRAAPARAAGARR
ncbi:MAG TPA: MarR family transcriptional regulator [Polyangia bacterium]|jgi:DNA-binding MarR family transcriptional regulator|nr:MarR family transcriptional regulator [Polyangia bacterium]